MFEKNLFILMSAAALVGPSALLAQTTPAAQQTTTAEAKGLTAILEGGVPHYIKAETPEQRQQRLGTSEDPGPNPDPNKHFWRFGKSYHIERYDARWANYSGADPGWVRPFGFVNLYAEIYQVNDNYVWVWMADPQPGEQQVVPTPPPKYNQEQLLLLSKLRSEFFELTPKQSDKTIRFEEASDGLPTSGSWRNSLAVADMNGDGCPDIVAPPERKGVGVPAIFLGDCKGHWKYWEQLKFPRGVDYGSVVAADFNRDGHMDLAFGIHLQGIAVFLGDGKGGFVESSSGLPKDFPTRRIAVADVDRDGYPDIVAISEGPTLSVSGKINGGRIRAYLNRKSGAEWKEVDIAGPERNVAGDWLTLANLRGSRYPDVIGSSIFFGSTDTLFVSDGPTKWKLLQADGSLVPYLSYYFASAAGKFSAKNHDDAIVSYVRFWPTDVDSSAIAPPPSKSIVGIDRITLFGKQRTRTPIARWAGNQGLWGLAAGDFDGDGNLDLIYTRSEPREVVILLGDGKGGFTRARIDGLTLEPNTTYDVKVADVNGDGRPDVILMYEALATSAFAPRDGSIRVFLNRGVVSAAKTAKEASKRGE